VPWVAIWAGYWRTFLLMITLPNIVVPGFYFCVPESASWLLSKGRVQQALKCFKRVAAFNGKTLPPEVVQTFEVNPPSFTCSNRQLRSPPRNTPNGV
jgi:hypothetical protein